MIRGWRNDPRWVEHYQRRDKERAEREIEFRKMRMEAVNAELLRRSLERPMRQAGERY